MDLPKEEKIEMQVWDINQINYFISKSQIYKYSIAYLLAIFTGMRKGEILALRWIDIDFEKKILYIRQILDGGGLDFKVGAKTTSGVRSIHIPASLIDQLNDHRKEMLAEKFKLGVNYNDNDLVVCTKYGNPVDPASFSKRFKKTG